MCGLVWIISCTGQQAERSETPGEVSELEAGMPEALVEMGSITFTTSDGVLIAGTFVGGTGEGARPAALLLPMRAKTRDSYGEFQQRLSSEGISSLAIDIRGHGDSNGDGNLDYRAFREAEWNATTNDVKGGLDWLRNQPGVDASLIGIVGASIGANLAVIVTAEELTAGTENPPKLLVLLSPGLNYSVRLDPGRARELGHTPVYIVSAVEDTQSYRGSQTLSQAARGGELHDFEGSEHGTDLFRANPGLMDEVTRWMSNRVVGVAVPANPTTTDIGEAATMESEVSEDGE